MNVNVSVSIPQYSARATIAAPVATATLNFTANISNMRIRTYLSDDVEHAPSAPGEKYNYVFTAFKNFALNKMFIYVGTATKICSRGDDNIVQEWDSENGKLTLKQGQRIPPNSEITVMGNLK